MTRTTVGELRKMLEDFSDNTEIVLKVRGNSTEDYSEKTIGVEDSYQCDNVIIIKDILSF
ncbi:MAG: hypothetical protein KHZ90_08620 [Veillonella parvula]|uniref:Uncharacterized protein n=1 Tax=Veillonella parvula TaxID=29466 RepID=A0A942WX50_VEIPA|nr:hypothetical protein [Veillonella parvula]MBS4893825.1 hypothetical protein [Veillonella parvula]